MMMKMRSTRRAYRCELVDSPSHHDQSSFDLLATYFSKASLHSLDPGNSDSEYLSVSFIGSGIDWILGF